MNSHKNHDHHEQGFHAEDCNGKSFYDLAVSALKDAKFRITRPRLAVIECLAESTVPLSPKSIYEVVQRKKDLKVDQVSVYRILEALIQLNLIHQIFPSGEYLPCSTRCDSNPSHVMLNCIQCGKVSEIHLEWSYIHKIFERVKKISKFEPTQHMLQIDGICAQCH